MKKASGPKTVKSVAKPPSSPLSRAAFAKGGAVKGHRGTTINIVVPSSGTPGAAKPAIPGAVGLAGGLPPSPLAIPPVAMPVAPPALPLAAKPTMATGGGVMAGAGGGLGRLQKARGRK